MTTPDRGVVRVRCRAAALAFALLFASISAHAARYEIDPIETKTTYSITYLGFIPVHGVFEKMTGWFEYDPTQPPGKREASIHVVIDATTLKPTTFDSESKRRMLRGPEFFNVDKFPTIDFKSNKFRFGADGKLFAIDGNITLVGVTKPVTFTVSKSLCEPAMAMRPARCTATTELVLKRFDFGIDGWARSVSDDVKIAVELVAIVPPAAQQLSPSPSAAPSLPLNVAVPMPSPASALSPGATKSTTPVLPQTTDEKPAAPPPVK
jgi:polyisoprenoid-binding protein YceI